MSTTVVGSASSPAPHSRISDGGEGETPSGEAIERRDRPCGDDVRRSDPPGGLLGAGADHVGPLEAERRHRLGQEGGTSCERLDQRDREIWSSHRKHDTGQPGA
jgi:hypothetical protein